MIGIDGNEHEPTSPAMLRVVAEEAGAPSSLPPTLDPLIESEYLRFSLKELFIATTTAAALLALFRAFGIFGALAAFIAAVAFTTIIFPWATHGQEPRQRLMFDFIWGVVMPVVCLVFDPLLFKRDNSDLVYLFAGMREMRRHDHPYIAYALIGWQVCVLCLWLLLGKVARTGASFISGMLAVGFTISLVLGIVLAFPATLGLIYYGIGAIGYTPCLTAHTYFRRAKLAFELSRQQRSMLNAGAAFAAGAVVAICLPSAAGIAIYFAVMDWPGLV